MMATIPACRRIAGAPGSGKTRELLARVRAAVDGGLRPEQIVVASPHPLAARRLGGAPLAALALRILEGNAFESGLALDLARIEDIDAETHFERAAGSLFSLAWVELVEPELGDAPSLDYEIAGLRTPERFAQAAYRLFRKLRGAGISPERFLDISLKKAAEWYANPPNLAHPDLLFATPDRYRDSLHADAPELERQRRREIDLAKILASVYERYIADAEARGCLTDVDAVAEATRVLETIPPAAARVRAQFPLAFIDDAQDLTVGELALLQAIYGESLDGVTFAGDPDQATRTFAGARPERVFACGTELALPGPEGAHGTIVTAAREFLREHTIATDPGDRLRVHRASSQSAEATLIAREVGAALTAGNAPESVAVLVRSLRGARPYVDALLDADIAVQLLGDVDLFADPIVQDALALLWAVHDPFRHDWLLRTLQTPTLRLSDATLVALCSEPAQPQAALFAEVEEDDANGPRGRWDRERDLRLGRNVTRGDRDAELEGDVRERLERFRERRQRWRRFFAGTTLEDAARAVVLEGGLFAPAPGETDAWSRYRRDTLDRFLARLATYARNDRTRTLGEALRYFETIATSEWPQCDAGDDARAGAVHVAAIDAIKGRTYATAFIPNLRAGAFPPYWVPDAFVFTTAFGIVPKDNVGEARAARTAKFTWYMHRAKIREQYANEDRRLLFCAMTRATERLIVSAWGSPSKGVAAPELLAELEAALGVPSGRATPRH